MPLGEAQTATGAAGATCGLVVPFAPVLKESVDGAMAAGFDFAAVPMAHAQNVRSGGSQFVGNARKAAPCAMRSSHALPEETWTSNVVAMASAWLDVDAECERMRRDSEAALMEEVGAAMHCGATIVVVPPPPAGAWACASYARALTSLVHAHMALTIWVQVPLNPHAPDTMEWWQTVRRMSHEHAGIAAALVLGADLPESTAEVNRWRGEHVGAVFIDADAFVANRKGYPTLPRAHQAVVAWYMDSGHARFCLSGDAGQAHWEYLSWLYQKRPPLDAQAAAEAGYRDYLQAPLQPLMDHLESSTYATFERDGAKYDAYERAVSAFLSDRAGAPVAEAAREPVRVLVAGAGRGPLVSASLRAADARGVPIRVTALEKNPYAFAGLRHRVATDALWDGRVELVHSDMRSFDPRALELPDVEFDAVVSELLGSLGDNELSPECLDGVVERVLAAGGVSIPRSYTSYIAPVSAYRAFAEARRYEDVKHMETPFVVKLHAHCLLAEPQPLHSFWHKRGDLPQESDRCHGDCGGDGSGMLLADNERTKRCVFARPDGVRATCHGLAGYFDCVLYGDVSLCTLPDERHTPNMGSWFPLYIPLREGFAVGSGEDVEASVWRRVGGGKVWYEWSVNGGAIHNVGARSSWVGL